MQGCNVVSGFVRSFSAYSYNFVSFVFEVDVDLLDQLLNNRPF